MKIQSQVIKMSFWIEKAIKLENNGQYDIINVICVLIIINQAKIGESNEI